MTACIVYTQARAHPLRTLIVESAAFLLAPPLHVLVLRHGGVFVLLMYRGVGASACSQVKPAHNPVDESPQQAELVVKAT
jgi:hypothetical protein